MDTIPTTQETPEEYAKKRALAEAVAELNSKEKSITTSKGYGKAYVMSILFPPIGLFYFVKYLFFDRGDREHVKAGVISLILTVVSMGISIISFVALLNQATSGLPAGDLKTLQDLMDPKKQQELLQLYK